MILAMSRPWKHPKSGVYWLRKRVPDDLLMLVSKRGETHVGNAETRHAITPPRLS